VQEGPDVPESEAHASSVTEFVKIGDTVRRPPTDSSESVRQLLVHLAHACFDGAPRFLGAEPNGSMVLSWIEGWVPADSECWRLGRSELASVGSCWGPIRTVSRGSLRGLASKKAPRPPRWVRWCAKGT